MPPPFVTFKEAAKVLSQLPKLSHCPTVTNIQSLVVDLMEKLGNIHLKQSMTFSYMEMVERTDIYTLTGADAWVDYDACVLTSGGGRLVLITQS